MNVASALKRTGHHREARDVGLEAVRSVRGDGPSRLLIDCLRNVGRIHLEFGDAVTARDLLEEAISTLEDFRRQGTDSRYRAELTASFDEIYKLLGRTLERLGADAEERWWTVERSTGRTLIESMVRQSDPPDRQSVTRILGSHLSPDAVLLHVYHNSERQLTCFVLQSREGRLHIHESDRRVPLKEIAVHMGGTATDKRITVPMFTPQHPEEFHYQLSWLGSHFLGPILDEIDLVGVNRIAFATQNLFSYLPWHAVTIPQTGTFLGRTFEW